jgi:hypothetical protein
MKKTVSETKRERIEAQRKRVRTASSERGLSAVKRAEEELKSLLQDYDPHDENKIKQLLEVLRTKGGYYDGTFAKYRNLFRKTAREYEKTTHPI